jgi:uncharacterized phage-associated protein
MDIKVKTIVQTIHFILSSIHQADKKKIIKLLFMADKHHLQLYSRTITNDNYKAMKHGPVGSIALDVLNLNMEYLEKDQIAYAESYLQRIGDVDFQAKTECKYEMLSETDKQSLNFIITEFGRLDSDTLEKMTHKYPEWAQYEPALIAETTSCEEISTRELFSSIKECPLNIPPEHIKNSQDIYCGYF